MAARVVPHRTPPRRSTACMHAPSKRVGRPIVGVHGAWRAHACLHTALVGRRRHVLRACVCLAHHPCSCWQRYCLGNHRHGYAPRTHEPACARAYLRRLFDGARSAPAEHTPALHKGTQRITEERAPAHAHAAAAPPPASGQVIERALCGALACARPMLPHPTPPHPSAG